MEAVLDGMGIGSLPEVPRFCANATYAAVFARADVRMLPGSVTFSLACIVSLS